MIRTLIILGSVRSMAAHLSLSLDRGLINSGATVMNLMAHLNPVITELIFIKYEKRLFISDSNNIESLY